ncbi:MAG TPA: polysaccharide deacetylase family protein [Rectinemataceae bacterium]|nr:polysaccharide deacetylase family protein [Rectinemataceae bacterium]
MKRQAVACALAGLLSMSLSADVEFRGPDFSKKGILLFAAQSSLPGGGSYDALFAADPASGDIRSLSYYPETISLVDGGRRLEIRNRFGLFRTDADLANPAAVAGFPNFERGSPVVNGSLPSASTSPDGNWVLQDEARSAAYGRLVLYDSRSGARSVVVDSIEYSVGGVPARWSPDSRYFVYAKGGSIYYYSIDQLLSSRVIDEGFRRIGPGRIEAVRWSSDGSLWYLRDSALYRILPAEFFTQALYQGIAGMGNLAGKIPFPFDPNFDDYWVSNDGQRIIFSKGGRNLFLVYLNPDDYGSTTKVAALPYLFLQGGTRVRDVIWPPFGPVTVFTRTIKGGATTPGAWRFDAPSDPSLIGLAPKVVELDTGGALEAQLSPDGTKIALAGPDGVTIRDYDTWKPLGSLVAQGTFHVLWRDETRLIVAGRDSIETWDSGTGERKTIALSRVEDFGWSESGDIVASVAGKTWKRAGPALGQAPQASISAGVPFSTSWAPTEAAERLDPSTSSPDWRAYLDTIATGPYHNAVMIRDIKGLGTSPLFPLPKNTWAAFPTQDDPRDPGIFDHGSRIRVREVSLVFDALDSADGLVGILNTLADTGIKATFFVNGEFVRRDPGASRLLADSGQEIGSMFFTTVDPTDARFGADRDYVRRGLARAEDLWFRATGKELSLLWHTPWYTTNSEVIAAGASMNYLFVGRDIDPLDWVGRSDAARMPDAYRSAHRIVEDIMARVKPGSIIPIRLGIPDGGRDDYLFNELLLLIDDLRSEGYAIVPVSTLMKHAE